MQYDIQVERATPENIAPYGHYLGGDEGVPIFTSWPGTMVNGPLPIEVGTGGEMLLVTTDAREFPVQCGLIERHFKHMQTYLPFNGKPFIMLLGEATEGDLPDYRTLRAFLFEDAGIIMHKGVWHDFPYAIEDGTKFSVILREEAHVNENTVPEHDMDADGPDLQRRAMRPRATIITHIKD
ncbi:ureidoglycolate lyase [Sphingobium aromaticivastans]|uniref:ureidoglycolate lyase n=1 Tax=Sphingobium aromaticivastans TaxID=1778665 RepID=UPI0030176341